MLRGRWDAAPRLCRSRRKQVQAAPAAIRQGRFGCLRCAAPRKAAWAPANADGPCAHLPPPLPHARPRWPARGFRGFVFADRTRAPNAPRRLAPEGQIALAPPMVGKIRPKELLSARSHLGGGLADCPDTTHRDCPELAAADAHARAPNRRSRAL